MKLRAIRVNQWRRFTRPAGIEGLADGLNVLVAPNEAGKSTLVGALRMALFTKHGTGGRDIEALLNHEAPNSPVVEVEFDLDGQPYTLRKRFTRGKQVRLVRPGGAELQGEGAETFLAELLGYTFPGRGVGTADTMGLWSLLWLDQGAGAEPIAAPDAAQRSVMGALEDTVGNLMGGEQGRRLSQALRAGLRELVTEAHGQPRGRYRDAIERVEAQQRVVAELEASHARTESDRRAYERVRAELLDREQANTDAEMTRELAETGARLEALLILEAEVDAAEAETARCRERLAQARRAQTDRAALIREIETLRADIARDRQALAAEEAEETRLESLWTAARAAQADAERTRQQADSALRQAERVLDGARLASGFAALESSLLRAEAAAAAAATLAARVAANPATPEAVAAVEEFVDGERSARAAMAAVATLVDFDLAEGAASRVSLSKGELPARGQSLRLIDPAVVHIAGIGSIRIRPQVADAGTLQSRHARAERDLGEALAALEAPDVAAVRQMARDREAAGRELREARGDLERIAPAEHGGVEGLRERRDRARAELQQLAAGGLDLTASADIDGAREAQAHASAAAREAAQAAALAAQTANAHRAALDDHRDALRAPLLALAGTEAQLRAKEEALIAVPDEATLEQQLAVAQQALDAQTELLEALRARASGDTVDLLRARRQRIEQSLASWREGINELKNRKAGLQTTLARDGAAGLGEKIAAAGRDLELVTEERDRLAREAAVLGLLNRELGGAETEARERFLGPVTDRVRPYLRMLFPAADITLDDALGVASVLRGERDIPDFGELSIGTREQINILTRIAIAELMVEQGKPAMVVIDDGLAHADDRRLDRMFDILALASEKVQILILSCHARAFERVGGRLLSIRQFEETEGLASS